MPASATGSGESASRRVWLWLSSFSNRQDVMVAHGERQLVQQPVHQCRPVAVEEPHEADLAFLRVTLGEGEGLRTLELAPQRIVSPLRRLNDFVMQRVDFVLQLAERGLCRAFERWIDLRN